MSDLAIPLPTPITEPAQAAEVYDRMYFTRFGWQSDGANVAFAAVIAPRSSTGRIHPNEATHTRITYQFTWAELQEIPEAATAFVAIAAAIPALAAAQRAKELAAQPQPEPEIVASEP